MAGDSSDYQNDEDRVVELSIETLRKMVAAKDYEYCFSNPAAGTPFESQPRF